MNSMTWLAERPAARVISGSRHRWSMVSPRSRRERPFVSKPRDFRYSEDRLVLLLREVARTGSLRAAARHLGMDPGNGLRLIRSAEAVLGAALVRGKTGGRRGGHTALTARGTKIAGKRVHRDPPSTTRWRCRLVGSLLPRAPVLVAVPDAGVQALVAAVTDSAIRELRLERGSRVLAQVKATALRLH